jgi:hypothetical protein
MDYEKESIMLIVDDQENPENSKVVEFDDHDLDDLIIALVDLKNELIAIRKLGEN